MSYWEVFFNNIFPCYQLMLFTREVISGIFSTNFFTSKLSWCLYLSYQGREPILSCYLHKKLSGYVFNNFFSWVKVIVVFVPKLSGLEPHITMLFTQILLGYVFNNFFYGSKLSRCLYLSYQVRECILSCYLQRSYRLYVFNNFSHGIKVIVVFVPNLSGQVADFIMLFTHKKVIRVFFQQLFFAGQNYRGVCT